MDFHSLSRRELQALCKRNKIPANLTNVAMADSLGALEIVEGIDEVMHACKSEIAQSSIGLRARLEVTSPYVNMTPVPSCVTSRRRRAVKGDSVVTQVTATRRSARLAEKSARLSKGVGNGNTDLSKKDLFTGDVQEFKINLQESLDTSDEMSGVTDMEGNSERKHEGQGDSAYEQEVSTVVKQVPTIEEEISNHTETEQLTEKSVVFLKEVCNENPDSLKKELSTDDCLVPLQDSPDVLDDITGVTGLDENSEKYGEAHVDSSEKQDMSIDGNLETTIVDEFDNLYENDEAKSKLKEGSSMEMKEQGDGSQSFVFAGVVANTTVEVNFEEKRDAAYHSNVSDVKSEIDVGHKIYDDHDTDEDEYTDEDAEIEKIADENTDEDAGSVDEDDSTTSEVSSDDDKTSNDENSDHDVTDFDENTDSSETESDPEETESIIWELTEDPTKTNVSLDCMPSEISLMSCEDDDIAAKQDLEAVEETETNVTTIDQFSGTDASSSEEDAIDEPKNTPTHQLAAAVLKNTTSIVKEEALPLIFTGSDDPSFITQPTLSTPKSAGRTYSRRARVAATSDNKENIGNGSKTAPAKERSKYVQEIAESLPLMDDQSMMKLSEDMKDLHLTQKSDKNEGENVVARTALQALPANQKAE